MAMLLRMDTILSILTLTLVQSVRFLSQYRMWLMWLRWNGHVEAGTRRVYVIV